MLASGSACSGPLSCPLFKFRKWRHIALIERTRGRSPYIIIGKLPYGHTNYRVGLYSLTMDVTSQDAVLVSAQLWYYKTDLRVTGSISNGINHGLPGSLAAVAPHGGK